MYKIDATIDHGNSGGAALDTTGRLIGMPTAVASDNGVIGYMIPSGVIQDFLAGKTDNYTIYNNKSAPDFAQYAKKLQSIYKNLKSIKDGPAKISDFTSYGFSLIGIGRTKDDTAFLYAFQDKTGQVRMNF